MLIYRTRREHRKLAHLVEAESRSRFPDLVRLSSLKRRKLAVKDRLSRLESGRFDA